MYNIIMAVYFFYGEEDFNISNEIEKLKKGLDKNFLEMSFKTFDNPNFPDLVAILRTQPMMFGKMLIVINCLDCFTKSFEDKEIKMISEALENNTDATDIVFVAQLPRDEGKKLDSRKKFFKLLKKYNAQEFAIIPSYKTAELEAWVIKQAKSKKLKLDKEAAAALVSQVGNNLRQLDGELTKLAIFAHPADTANADMVRTICISNDDLFAFSDYLMQGNKEKALLEYRKLLDKKHPLEILAFLQTMSQRWIRWKSKSAECTPAELSRLTGQHEYVIKLSLQKMKKVSLKELVYLKQRLIRAEQNIKVGLALSPEMEVENAILY